MAEKQGEMEGFNDTLKKILEVQNELLTLHKDQLINMNRELREIKIRISEMGK